MSLRYSSCEPVQTHRIPFSTSFRRSKFSRARLCISGGKKSKSAQKSALVKCFKSRGSSPRGVLRAISQTPDRVCRKRHPVRFRGPTAPLRAREASLSIPPVPQATTPESALQSLLVSSSAYDVSASAAPLGTSRTSSPAIVKSMSSGTDSFWRIMYSDSSSSM